MHSLRFLVLVHSTIRVCLLATRQHVPSPLHASRTRRFYLYASRHAHSLIARQIFCCTAACNLRESALHWPAR